MQCRAPIAVVVAGRVCVKQERGKGEGGKCQGDLACDVGRGHADWSSVREAGA